MTEVLDGCMASFGLFHFTKIIVIFVLLFLFHQDFFYFQDNVIRDGNEPVRWGNANENRRNQAAGVGEAHQALLNVQGPSGFQPYFRPPLFHLRVSLSQVTRTQFL